MRLSKLCIEITELGWPGNGIGGSDRDPRWSG